MGWAGEEIERGEQKLHFKEDFFHFLVKHEIKLQLMAHNYFISTFQIHFLLLFTVLEQELYCCAKSAKKITPYSQWHSSLKKQKANYRVRLAAYSPWNPHLPLLGQETVAATTPLIWGGTVTSAFPVMSESASAPLPRGLWEWFTLVPPKGGPHAYADGWYEAVPGVINTPSWQGWKVLPLVILIQSLPCCWRERLALVLVCVV